MGKFSRIGNDLYGGRRSIDFVGQRGLWYGVSLVLVALAIAVVFIKGLNMGIEFTGGTQIRVPLEASQVNQGTVDDLQRAVADTGIEGTEAPVVNTSGDSAILVQIEALDRTDTDQVAAAIGEEVGVNVEDLSQDEIGPSWGREVAERAGLGVLIFLFLVVLFIWGYFREWKMSVAALVALFHDIAITIGVYALSGFQVTPSAVTGLLAILGFSLYDTVVVFDKVKENTTTLRRSGQSYTQAANLAVNQTLVRSINTGIVALIPIGAILYVSSIQLGASSLQDLALSQFVGMAAGVYSSVMLAPRVLVHLKSGEKDIISQDRRAKARTKSRADKYASVPAFTDDLPVQHDPDDRDQVDEDDFDEERPVATASSDRTSGREADRPASRTDRGPTGRGRTAPVTRAPVGESRSSGRQQPKRQTKSERKK